MQSSAKIIVFANYFPPQVGGLERYVEGLFVAVKDISDQEIIIVTHRSNSLPAASNTRNHRGLVIVELTPLVSIAGVFCIPNPFELFSFLRLHNRHNTALISTHTRFMPLTLLGTIWAKFSAIPIVYTEHGSDFVRFPSSRLIEYLAKIYDLTLGRLSIALSHRKTGASRSAAAFVAKLWDCEVEVLANAIDLDFWSDQFSSSYDHFVYVGRIASGKGWDTAIEAYKSLPSSLRAKYHLVIIGSGPENDLLAAMSADDPCIRWLGAQDQQGIRSHLRDGILLNPTRLSESLQTVLLEGAAAGSWILSAPTSEAIDFLKNGFGTIVHENWAKAMLDVIEFPPAPSNREFLKNFCWHDRARQFTSICDSLHKDKDRV